MNSYWAKYIQSPAFDADALHKAVMREKAERSLDDFIKQAWKVIEPGTTYVDNWHIALIAEHLQAVNDGEIRRHKGPHRSLGQGGATCAGTPRPGPRPGAWW